MGPVLVNKRPSKGKVDGRTMLEKAQERKMIANLEKAKCKSKSTNSFVALCTSDVIRISRDVGISLGPGIESANGYVDEILNSIDLRSNTFRESCPSCHTTDDSGARVSKKMVMSRGVLLLPHQLAKLSYLRLMGMIEIEGSGPK
jgi:hypothetical protein